MTKRKAALTPHAHCSDSLIIHQEAVTQSSRCHKQHRQRSRGDPRVGGARRRGRIPSGRFQPTMDASMGDLALCDAEMRALTPDTEPEGNAGDEVEQLWNSLHEAVHDEKVQPKMQFLIMDSAFSMVALQGEDSGIAWETTPSRCATPVSPIPPRTSCAPAGRILLVMDEELMSKRRKTRAGGHKDEPPAESCDDISGRPELVGAAQLNIQKQKNREDKEQSLFSLVSEGSEILNIVVPHKLLTVDEEESKCMVDNLSYLEESSPKADRAEEESSHRVMELSGFSQASTGSCSAAREHPTPLLGSGDPPGAPGMESAKNEDYFEAYTLIDDQAPGSPAVIAHRHREPEAAARKQDAETPVEAGDTGEDSPEGLSSELLDEFFYSGTNNYPMKSHLEATKVSQPPSKLNGSPLFGNEEDILTPVFLPEGPQKTIDPILLEEPKAMAFLYDDLYEEATGSWEKEDDAVSMTSEKSFHSRHSDREARGYMEKYVLIDETPAVDGQPTTEEEVLLSQDLDDVEDGPSKSPNSSEEITDFFRSSATSSPCDMFLVSQEEDESPSITNTRDNISGVEDTAIPQNPLDEFSWESDWEGMDDYDVSTDLEMWKPDPEAPSPSPSPSPSPPPRRKATSSLEKACLSLAPLTPAEDSEDASLKEQRKEEKEAASPAETGDEEDGDQEVHVPSCVSVEEPAEEKDTGKAFDSEVALAQLDASESETFHPKKEEVHHLTRAQCVIL
uniref:cardiomyopathy-associated protein 5 isoform X2 n=1 Tax=Doryrhamphus excisus TaxID=161450 RepID=UPI0025ADA400|nr:cardiomyopathy-associated protein 5 isoform X2 [Doryrhamphus excisus]